MWSIGLSTSWSLKQYIAYPKLILRNVVDFTLKLEYMLLSNSKFQIVMWISWIFLHAFFPMIVCFLPYSIATIFHLSSSWHFHLTFPHVRMKCLMWEGSHLGMRMECLFTLPILNNWTMRWPSMLVKSYACHGSWSLCDNFDSPMRRWQWS